MSLEKAIRCIRKNKRFLITAHMGLEGDALGAELGFYNLLKKLGKQAIIVNQDALPHSYDFLPRINVIRQYKKDFLKDIKFDCFAVLDCADLDRAGRVRRLNTENKPILNIDHHISNQRFGRINWIEPNASSCSEMIYKLYKKMCVPLDKESAICLYVGILTDTGSFHYSNTHSSTHQAAAELLSCGVDAPSIYRKVYESIPLEDLKSLSRILPKIKCGAGGKIAWFQLKQNILKNKNPCFDLSERLLSFGRSIKGIEVVALFRSNFSLRDTVRVNLRSQGKVDVNRIAARFGGGGHKTASGITIKGEIEEARKKVLAEIQKQLRRRK
ncbi:MAG: bifunctional oligoribonuclease/PAP phosphatase NrnA [Candidatus Omnitrophica bacterium]|nr:bifunctional oligoribonuclease/PAP phosphatase NrnA [Candidatus Omnitrophota bacterium]